MTWAAVAVGVGSAVIGAGSSIAGANKQAKAAKNAANMQMGMFNTINQQQQPFIQGGYGSMGRLNTLLGLNPRALPAPANSSQYQPTPGGGVQPIMQMPQPQQRMYAGGPGGDPSGGMQGGSPRLAQILQLRAAHGDTQAGAMLQRLGTGV